MTRIFLILALLSLVACSKNKKEETDPDKGSVGDTSTSGASDTSGDSSADKTSPELQHLVYFEFDAAELDDVARRKLSENAEWLREDPSRTLTIEGHTDESGTTDYNLALGERRARTALDYLIRLGIDASRIKVITYGEERPAGSEQALNRRSVFVATKNK